MKKLILPNLTAQEKADEASLHRRLGPVDPERRKRQLAAERRVERERAAARKA